VNAAQVREPQTAVEIASSQDG